MSDRAKSIRDGSRQRWQGMLESLVDLTDADLARILRVDRPAAEVFAEQRAPGVADLPPAAADARPFHAAVVERRAAFALTDAAADPRWRDAPAAALGFPSYLGLPLFWPGGAFFGVVEIFARRPGLFAAAHRRLLEQVRHGIETDEIRGTR